jgi:integrase/recombinase XerD
VQFVVQVSRYRGGKISFYCSGVLFARECSSVDFSFLLSTGDTLMAESTFFTGPLRTKMSEDLQLTGKAKRTHDGYLREIRKLADYCRQTPDRISEEQMRRYFLHLKNERNFAAGSLTVTLSALKFFYRITCPCDWVTLEQLKVKGPKTLPEVITIDQVSTRL